MLEGGGPAKADLAARVAAICAEPGERDQVAQAVRRAIAVERMLMAGKRFASSEDSPLRAVTEIEELLRVMLRDAATGEVGLDLRATADEILIADGLNLGESAPPKVGETAEWRLPDPEAGEELDLEPAGPAERETDAMRPVDPSEQETRIIAAGVELAGEMARRDPDATGDDWLAAEDSEEQLDWPAFASPRRGRRERAPDTERVRYLFPVPDDADWSVGELDYDRDSARVK
jgi:hypothetical protein